MGRAVILGVMLSLAAGLAFAGSVVPVRPIPAQTVITGTDVAIQPAQITGAAVKLEDVLGLEARSTLYPGRAIMLGDVGPPAIVERNDIVRLVFRRGALSILTEGRVLDRGAAGERIRIMNLDSRAVISGVLKSDKTVEVAR